MVRDANLDAYQIMAEMLVTVRRIVHRGLEKASGKTWYLDGCPPGLFERLVERKENEVAVDRFDEEYQELISYASFDDFAEIIDYNKDLAKLLSGIAPKNATMAERLRELEVLRLKLAATVPFEEDDIDRLLEYHRDFRDAVARRMKKSGDATPTPAPRQQPEEPPDEEVAAEDAEVDELGEDEEVTAEDTEIDELGADDEVRDDEPPAETPETGESAEPGAAGDVDEAARVERAMADNDDAEVLRILHSEIMSVAEAVYQRDLDRTHPVWETLKASGWYDRKKTALALAPLELFYEVSEEARNRQQSGADLDELKAYLDEVEFSKLLLSLREMFMRHNL